MLRRVRPARYSDADPFKLIEVPSSDLRMMQRRWSGDLDLPWLERGTFGRWSSHRRRWHAGRVLDGDWDLACEPFDDYHLSRIVRERFVDGREWTEIHYIRRALKKVGRGERAWGGRCVTAAEVMARCQYIDRLHQHLKTHGYRRDADARFTHFLVNIGRDGEIIRNNDGKHRIILSRLLGIPYLPARVLVRHPRWQAVRDAIKLGDCRLAARHARHPDLADLALTAGPISGPIDHEKQAVTKPTNHAPSKSSTASCRTIARCLAAAIAGVLALGPQWAAADEPDKPMVEYRTLLALDFELEQGFSDMDGRRAREFEAEPLLRFAATIAPGRQWSGFFEADFLSQITWERGEPRDVKNIARINQAYLRYDDDIELRFGRWLYRDEREWLFDENIDGILLSFELGEVSVDALAGRAGALPRELFNPSSRGDRTNHYAILAEVEPARDIHHAAFAILGDDRDGSGDYQVSLGVRSYGELDFGLDYWANAGLSRGKAEGRRLNGYGFDIGGTYRLGADPLQPRLTLGYAWGSGDPDPAGATDRAYRQTGLQSNEASLGGLAKFKYYGEALDPDLSNIAIATAGVGITSDERLSFDIFYHHYRQVEAVTSGSRHIGDGLDLVIGYRPTRNIEIEAALGWFESGGNPTAPQSGLAARLELEYAF